MRIITRRTLREFYEKHADCKSQLEAWHQEAEHASWSNSHEIKKEYPSASFLADNRVVFNIKGNNYRLIVKISYKYQTIWIRFVGTHAEYDRIDANTI